MQDIYLSTQTNELYIRTKSNELSKFILYDISPKKVLQAEFKNFTSLNASHLSKGIYIYELSGMNGIVKKGKVVKD